VCAPGTFAPAPGSAACLPCPAGQYCLGGAHRAPCDAFSTSAAGAMSLPGGCTCLPGHYRAYTLANTWQCRVCRVPEFCSGTPINLELSVVLPWAGSADLARRSNDLWGSVAAATRSESVDPPNFDVTYTQTSAVFLDAAEGADVPDAGVTRLLDEVTVLFTVDMRNTLVACPGRATEALAARVARDCAFRALSAPADAPGLEYRYAYARHAASAHLLDVWSTVAVPRAGVGAVRVDPAACEASLQCAPRATASVADAGGGPGGAGELLRPFPADADAWGATDFPLRLPAFAPCRPAVLSPGLLRDDDLPCQRSGCFYVLGYDAGGGNATADAPMQLFMFQQREGALFARATPSGNSSARAHNYAEMVDACGAAAGVPQSATRAGVVLLAARAAVRVVEQRFARRVQTLARRVPREALLAPGGANYSIAAAPGRNFSLLRTEASFLARNIRAPSAAAARLVLQAAVAADGGGGVVALHRISYDLEAFKALLPCALPLQSVNAAGFCQCNQGFFGRFGEACAPCGPGFQEAGAFRMACALCPVNSFCANSTHAAKCPPGSTSPAGAATQSSCTCAGGFLGPSGGPCRACTPDAPCESAGALQSTSIGLRLGFSRGPPAAGFLPIDFMAQTRAIVENIRRVDPAAAPPLVDFRFPSRATQTLPLGPPLLAESMGVLALGENIQASMAARLAQPPAASTIRVLSTELAMMAVFAAPRFYGAARTKADLANAFRNEGGSCAVNDITVLPDPSRLDGFMTTVLCRGIMSSSPSARFERIRMLYRMHPGIRRAPARRMLAEDADGWAEGIVQVTDNLETIVVFMTDPVEILESIEEVLRGTTGGAADEAVAEFNISISAETSFSMGVTLTSQDPTFATRVQASLQDDVALASAFPPGALEVLAVVLADQEPVVCPPQANWSNAAGACACVLGFAGPPEGPCEPCPAGSYSGVSRARCLPCLFGYYCAGGAAPQAACPSNSTVPAGAGQSARDCQCESGLALQGPDHEPPGEARCEACLPSDASCETGTVLRAMRVLVPTEAPAASLRAAAARLPAPAAFLYTLRSQQALALPAALAAPAAARVAVNTALSYPAGYDSLAVDADEVRWEGVVLDPLLSSQALRAQLLALPWGAPAPEIRAVGDPSTNGAHRVALLLDTADRARAAAQLALLLEMQTQLAPTMIGGPAVSHRLDLLVTLPQDPLPASQLRAVVQGALRQPLPAPGAEVAVREVAVLAVGVLPAAELARIASDLGLNMSAVAETPRLAPVLQCPAHAVKNPARGFVCECEAGFALGPAGCTLCAPGTAALQGAPCSVCPPNVFCVGGRGAGEACPLRTSAPAGSRSAAACLCVDGYEASANGCLLCSSPDPAACEAWRVLSRRSVEAPAASADELATLEHALTDTAGVTITNFAYTWAGNRTTSPGGAAPSFFTALPGMQTALNIALRIAPASTPTLSFPAHFLHWEQALPLRALSAAEIAAVLLQTVRGATHCAVVADPPGTLEAFPTLKRASLRVTLQDAGVLSLRSIHMQLMQDLADALAALAARSGQPLPRPDVPLEVLHARADMAISRGWVRDAMTAVLGFDGAALPVGLALAFEVEVAGATAFDAVIAAAPRARASLPNNTAVAPVACAAGMVRSFNAEREMWMCLCGLGQVPAPGAVSGAYSAACATCPAGTVVGPDRTACLECRENHYCAGGGAMEPCPANSVSQTGARSEAECFCASGFQRGAGCVPCGPGDVCLGKNFANTQRVVLPAFAALSVAQLAQYEQALAAEGIVPDAYVYDVAVRRELPLSSGTYAVLDPVPGLDAGYQTALNHLLGRPTSTPSLLVSAFQVRWDGTVCQTLNLRAPFRDEVQSRLDVAQSGLRPMQYGWPVPLAADAPRWTVRVDAAPGACGASCARAAACMNVSLALEQLASAESTDRRRTQVFAALATALPEIVLGGAAQWPAAAPYELLVARVTLPRRPLAPSSNALQAALETLFRGAGGQAPRAEVRGLAYAFTYHVGPNTTAALVADRLARVHAARGVPFEMLPLASAVSDPPACGAFAARIATRSGAFECMCVSGYAGAGAEDGACAPCAAGTFSDWGTDQRAQCQLCPAGSFCRGGDLADVESCHAQKFDSHSAPGARALSDCFCRPGLQEAQAPSGLQYCEVCAAVFCPPHTVRQTVAVWVLDSRALMALGAAPRLAWLRQLATGATIRDLEYVVRVSADIRRMQNMYSLVVAQLAPLPDGMLAGVRAALRLPLQGTALAVAGHALEFAVRMAVPSLTREELRARVRLELGARWGASVLVLGADASKNVTVRVDVAGMPDAAKVELIMQAWDVLSALPAAPALQRADLRITESLEARLSVSEHNARPEADVAAAVIRAIKMPTASEQSLAAAVPRVQVWMQRPDDSLTWIPAAALDAMAKLLPPPRPQLLLSARSYDPAPSAPCPPHAAFNASGACVCAPGFAGAPCLPCAPGTYSAPAGECLPCLFGRFCLGGSSPQALCPMLAPHAWPGARGPGACFAGATAPLAQSVLLRGSGGLAARSAEQQEAWLAQGEALARPVLGAGAAVVEVGFFVRLRAPLAGFAPTARDATSSQPQVLNADMCDALQVPHSLSTLEVQAHEIVCAATVPYFQDTPAAAALALQAAVGSTALARVTAPEDDATAKIVAVTMPAQGLATDAKTLLAQRVWAQVAQLLLARSPSVTASMVEGARACSETVLVLVRAPTVAYWTPAAILAYVHEVLGGAAATAAVDSVSVRFATASALARAAPVGALEAALQAWPGAGEPMRVAAAENFAPGPARACPQHAVLGAGAGGACACSLAAGFTGPPSGPCVLCAAGFYITGGACAVCPSDSFCPGLGVREPCEPGRFSVAGARAASGCHCPWNTVASSKGGCAACAPGAAAACQATVVRARVVLRVSELELLASAAAASGALAAAVRTRLGTLTGAREVLTAPDSPYVYELSAVYNLADPTEAARLAQAARAPAANTSSRQVLWQARLLRSWQTAAQVQAGLAAGFAACPGGSVHVHTAARNTHDIRVTADTTADTAAQEAQCVESARGMLAALGASLRAADSLSASALTHETLLRLGADGLVGRAQLPDPEWLPLRAELRAVLVAFECWGVTDASRVQPASARDPELQALLGAGYGFGAMSAAAVALRPCPAGAERSDAGHVCACSAGHVARSAAGADGGCVRCAPGSVESAGACARCAFGQFCTGGTHSERCPPLTSSQQDAVSVRSCFCVAGYVPVMGAFASAFTCRLSTAAVLPSETLMDVQQRELAFRVSFGERALAGLALEESGTTASRRGVSMRAVLDVALAGFGAVQPAEPPYTYEVRIDETLGRHAGAGFVFTLPSALARFEEQSAAGAGALQLESRVATVSGDLRAGLAPADLAPAVRAFLQRRMLDPANVTVAGGVVRLQLAALAEADARPWLLALAALRTDEELALWRSGSASMQQSALLSLPRAALSRPQDVIELLRPAGAAASATFVVQAAHANLVLAQEVSAGAPESLQGTILANVGFQEIAKRIAGVAGEAPTVSARGTSLPTCPAATVRTGGRCRCLPGARPGAAGCLPCGAGYYCPGRDVRELCPGAALTSVAAVQAANTALDLLSSARCVCPAGTRGGGGAACVRCARGFYCAANEAVMQCPANAWSPEGSSARAHCVCDVGFDPAGTGALQDPWSVCTRCVGCAPRVELAMTLPGVALGAFGNAPAAMQALLVSAAAAASLPTSAVRVTSIEYGFAYRARLTRAMLGVLTPHAAAAALAAAQAQAGAAAAVRMGAVDLDIRATVASADDAAAFNVFVDDIAFINDPRRRLLQAGASACGKVVFAGAGLAVQCKVPISGEHRLAQVFDYRPTNAGFDFDMALTFELSIVSRALLDSGAVRAAIADAFEASIDNRAAENTVAGRMRVLAAAPPVAVAPVVVLLVFEAEAFDIDTTARRLAADALLVTLAGAARGAAPVSVAFRAAQNTPAGAAAPGSVPVLIGVGGGTFVPVDRGQACSPSATKSKGTAFACVCQTGAVCEPLPVDPGLGCAAAGGHVCAPGSDPAAARVPLEVWVGVACAMLFAVGIVAGFLVHVRSRRRARSRQMMYQGLHQQDPAFAY